MRQRYLTRWRKFGSTNQTMMVVYFSIMIVLTAFIFMRMPGLQRWVNEIIPNPLLQGLMTLMIISIFPFLFVIGLFMAASYGTPGSFFIGWSPSNKLGKYSAKDMLARFYLFIGILMGIIVCVLYWWGLL